jgi:hypothetical protein
MNLVRMRWIAFCAVLAAAPAHAQVTPMDLQVAGRALGFLDKPLSGDIQVVVVYAQNSPQSVEAAESLRSQMGAGLKVGNSTLRPVLVPLTEIGKVNAGLLFLAPGAGAEADALKQVVQAKHLACFTTDIAQVQAGRCAVGVRSQPRIEIIVNRAAAAASGVSFSTVFRMMITEI